MSKMKSKTYILQLSQDIFGNAVFVKLILNVENDIVYDSAVDSWLKNTNVLKPSCTTTITSW